MLHRTPGIVDVPLPGRGAACRRVLCRRIVLATAFCLVSASGAAYGQAPAPAPRMPHPPLVLRDEAGRNVLESGKPISTRRTCGGDCHDYDFISDSFHFQQGKAEMDRALLNRHGAPTFNSSPGMFGKFSIIPNRQLTHAGIRDAADADMSQPEWLMKCGGCHTGGGISEYDLKGRRFLTPEARPSGPLDPSYTIRDREKGEVLPWDWRKSGIAEADCFLCHVPKASRAARKKETGAGNFRWANNATLLDTGIVSAKGDGTYTYNRGAFNADGTVKAPALALSDPVLENCAMCHGFSARHTGTIQAIQHADIMRGTEKAGWVYNGANISDTVSPKIVGKEKMKHPWDAHAAKGVICIDCHYAPNNPGRMSHEDNQKNLRFRPAGEDIATYLKRPDHNFARGNIPPETVNLTRKNTMRGCDECHDTSRTHNFLPYKTRHFQALACQTCHIPAVHFWAYRSDDWGFLMDTGTSRITYRGIEGSIVDPESDVTGFLPAYIPTPDRNNRPQIRPTNLITGVYWFDKSRNRPVFTWQVQQAFFENRPNEGEWKYRPEIVKTFGDRDGIIDVPQAVYDTPAKIAVVKELLQKHAGVADPELRVEVVPWAMSHSTVGKGQAVKECTACHARNSMLNRPMDLNTFLPKGTPVIYRGQTLNVVNFEGKEPTFDNRELLASFYIIGNSRVAWVEWLGWLSVGGALLFSIVHGSLRAWKGRS